MYRKSTLIEYLTAIALMAIVSYIFMRRANNQFLERINNVDTGLYNTNRNLHTINGNILNFYPHIDTMDQKLNYSINKEYEILDSLSVNNQLLRRNIIMLEQQSSNIKQINRKQNTILDSIKDKTIYYFPCP